MKNKGKILGQSIDDLPAYEPDESVLSRLENSLFEFPADEMPIYEPYVNLWNDIENTMSKLDKKTLINRNSLLFLLFLLLSFAGGHQLYYSDPILNEPNSTSGQIKTTYNEINTTNPNTTSVQSTITKNEPQTHQHNQPVNIIYNFKAEKPNKSYQATITPELNNGKSDSPTLFSKITPIKNISVQSIQKEDNLDSPTSTISGITQNDLDCSEFTGPSGYFSAGITGTYNYFMDNGSEPNKTDKLEWNSVNMELSYHRERLYFSTGVGVVFSSDYSKLEYRYLKNELVNTYENVDSMYYDPITGLTEFFTVTVEVYDSIEYQKSQEIKTSYKYVQIPLSIGYNFILKPKYSIGLSTGLTYIFLYEKSNNYPVLQFEDAKLLDENFTSPTRNKDIFRLDIQMDLSFKLTRRLHTTITPSINFYNKSIYNTAKKTTPYSIGIKGGIFYIF